jgi:hypothetical protein
VFAGAFFPKLAWRASRSGKRKELDNSNKKVHTQFHPIFLRDPEHLNLQAIL